MRIEALIRGDRDAFKRLYMEKFEGLCNYASVLVSDDEAGDIVQDIFLSLWNRRESLPIATDAEIDHYLIRSVRNRAISLRRRQEVRDRHSPQIAAELSDIDKWSEEFDTASGDGDSPSPHSADRIRDLINSLPERSRELLILRWYQGMDFEAISSVMGISYSYAHVLHSRAMAMVRKKLGLKKN